MRCCAHGCKNDSRHLSKSQGITFHVFPTDQNLRDAWLRALGKVDWEPKERSAVCSKHFHSDDLYETRRGLRRVKAGAVPITMDLVNSTSLQVCRICLAIKTRLFCIRSYKLTDVFEQLTEQKLNFDDGLPQNLCSECATKLQKFYKFKESTQKSYNLLLKMQAENEHLTEENFKNIDHKGFPTLEKTIKIDEYDLNIEHDSNIEHKEVQEDIITEIKPDIDQEPQSDVETNIFANEISDLPQTESEKDYPDFDSDDSLPLEVTKKKKKTKQVKRLKKKKIIEPKIDRRRKPFLNPDLNETLFTIIDLSYEEQLAEIEKRRETDNFKHAAFKCNECFKGFLDQDAYNSHMIRHTSACGEHQCGVCKAHFKHSHALRKHITAHHTQRFSCNQCNYVTTHRQTARLHERWHKGTKYVCPHCLEEFVKFTTYMGHVRIKHPSDFVCELCGYSFVSAKGIELHKKLKHRGDDGVVPEDGPFCELCNVRFATQEAHRKHLSISAKHASQDRNENNRKKGRKTLEMREREKNSNEVEDEDDERRRIYPSQLRKAEGPIPCEQCGIQLEDSRAYHGHFRRVHPDKNRTKYPSMKSPCMCEVCGRIFQSYALLKDHRWVHTGERPFKCDQCDKSFRMKQRLVAHRRVHSAVKTSYVCAVCGKHFSTHSNRQRHMFIHTGLKPYKCEMCGKGFKHASEKRAHITYVHLKKPWPKRSRGKRGRQTPPPNQQEQEICEDIQPVWPSCDPKLTDINLINDKPMYYNVKI